MRSAIWPTSDCVPLRYHLRTAAPTLLRNEQARPPYTKGHSGLKILMIMEYY